MLDTLERHIARSDTAASADRFTAAEVRNIRNLALYSWRRASRDSAMGENSIWLATTRYPHDRVIVWAHNNHIITDHWMFFDASDLMIRKMIGRASDDAKGRSTYFGETVKRFFGDQVFSMATLVDSGHYSPDIGPALVGKVGNFDSLRVLKPAPPGTVEAALAAAGHDVAFLDLRPFLAARVPVSARALDYTTIPPLAMRYWQGYDAFLFRAETFGLNESPARGTILH